MELITISNIKINVVRKDIKNIHLAVYPPTGRVRIAAPLRVNEGAIRLFAISKLGWIKRQQRKFEGQERISPREYKDRESHYFQGRRYLLKVIECDATPKVILKHSVIELFVRPKANKEKKKTVLDEWYRQKLKQTIPTLIEKWETKMGVVVDEFGVKKMKTKWGTCNREAKRIWLNLELAKKPAQCLEYIVVHEMVHLLERKHNDRFVSLINKFLPKWKSYKDDLNRLPVGHDDWKY